MALDPGHPGRKRAAVLGGLALVGAGVLVAALTGGLDKAPEKGPRVVPPGALIDQGEFRTRVLRAYVGRRGDVERESMGAGKRRRYLSVEFEVTSQTGETVDLMEFTGNPFIRQQVFADIAQGWSRVWGRIDWVGRLPRRSEDIPPRMTVPLTMAWYGWAGPDPRAVTVRLPGYEFSRPVFLDMPATWQTKLVPNKTTDVRDDPAEIIARVTLPVTARDVP